MTPITTHPLQAEPYSLARATPQRLLIDSATADPKEIVGLTISVLLHCVVFFLMIANRPTQGSRLELPRVSWVEFAPIGTDSSVESPELLQEQLAIRNATSRSVAASVKASSPKPAAQISTAQTKAPSRPTLTTDTGSKDDTEPTSTNPGDSAPVGRQEITAAGLTAASRRGPLQVSYEAAILSRLERVKRYPTRAIQRRLEGELLMALSIASDGSVLSANLRSSSGHEVFDTEALKMVSRAAPFPRLPEELGSPSLDLLVPIAFELR